MSDETDKTIQAKKPRKRRSDSTAEFYEGTAAMMGRSAKTVRNEVSRARALSAAVGGDKFILEHLAGSKLDNRRTQEAIIRLSKKYSVTAIRKFIFEHKGTGFPAWLIAKPDTTMGQILRLLKKTTPAERETLESIIGDMCNEDYEAEKARKASPTGEADGGGQ
jgi:hypothetical protein